MKKFFSILCAFAIVFSASAAQVSKKDVFTKKAAKKEIRSQHIAKDVAKSATFKAPVAKVSSEANKHVLAGLQVVGVEKKAVKNVAFKAPQAKKEVIDLTFTSENADVEWDDQCSAEGWWQIMAEDEDYLVSLSNAGDRTEAAGSYVWNDMDTTYSFVWGDSKVFFADGSCTVTVDETDALKVVVAGSFTGKDGNTYNINIEYVEKPFVLTGDTVRYDFTTTAKLSYSSYWEDWTISADDGVFGIALDILSENAESPVGVYATEDFDLQYTGIEIYDESGEESEVVMAHDAAAEIIERNDSILIEATIVGNDGVVYEASLFFAAPKKEKEATITATDLEINDDFLSWFGVVLAYASNEDFAEIYFSLSPDSTDYFGTYTIGDDASCELLTKDSVTIEAYSGEITLARTADTIVTLTGKVLCFDNTEYTLNLTGLVPAIEVSDMTFSFKADEEGITVTPSNDEDAWDWFVVSEEVFEAYGAEYIAEAIYSQYGDSYAVTGEQTLTFEDDLAYYTSAGGKFFLVVWGAGANNITTEAAEFEFEVEGSGDNCTQYDAEEGNDFEVFFAEFDIDDQYLEKYGVIVVSAETEEGEYISLEFAVAEGTTTLEAGEYPVLADGDAPFVAAGELDLNQGYIYGSFAGNLTAEGIDVPLWLLIDGKVIVAENGAITVDAVNCAGAAIKCTLGAAEGIENVVLTESAKKVVVDGAVYVIRDNKIFNVLGTQVR